MNRLTTLSSSLARALAVVSMIGCAGDADPGDSSEDLGSEPVDAAPCDADGFAPLTDYCYRGPCCEPLSVDLLPENGCRPECPAGYTDVCTPDPTTECGVETYAACERDDICGVIGCDADGEVVSAVRWRMTAAPEVFECEGALRSRAAARCDPEGLCQGYDPLTLDATECTSSEECVAYVPSCWFDGEDVIGRAGFIAAHQDDRADIESFACPRGAGEPTSLPPVPPGSEVICFAGRCVRP